MLKGHYDLINSVTFASNGEILVSASEDTTIKVWNIATGQMLHTLQGHSGAVTSAIIWGHKGEIISGSEDLNIGIWSY